MILFPLSDFISRESRGDIGVRADPEVPRDVATSGRVSLYQFTAIVVLYYS